MKTTILIESEIRERLKKFGVKGDTYDQILTRLMDFKEGSKK